MALSEADVKRVNALLAQLDDIESILYTAQFKRIPNGTLELGGKTFFDPSQAVRRGFAQAWADTRAALAEMVVVAREPPDHVRHWLPDSP